MFAFPRSRRLLALLAAAVVAGLVALAITAFGMADAKTGIKTIGPGPSSNTAGVKCIQRALGISPVDGRYGQATYTAVKRFQKAKGLPADGAVGPQTGSRLLSRTPVGCASSIPTAPQTGTTSSVPSPKPGRTLTSSERCAKLGMGWIVYNGTRCILDGAVRGGLSPRECVKQAAGSKAYNEAIKHGLSEEAARVLAQAAVKKALSAYSAASASKCILWDLDPKEVRKYQSVPMPS